MHVKKKRAKQNSQRKEGPLVWWRGGLRDASEQCYWGEMATFYSRPMNMFSMLELIPAVPSPFPLTNTQSSPLVSREIFLPWGGLDRTPGSRSQPLPKPRPPGPSIPDIIWGLFVVSHPRACELHEEGHRLALLHASPQQKAWPSAPTGRLECSSHPTPSQPDGLHTQGATGDVGLDSVWLGDWSLQGRERASAPFVPAWACYKCRPPGPPSLAHPSPPFDHIPK